MSLLLACLFTTAGCSTDASLAGPANSVASVAVAVDSSTLSVGNAAQVSITATDVAGMPMPVSDVAWTAITPGIVSVSSSGGVRAISSGEAVIEARVANSTGRVTFVITDSILGLARNSFDSGALAPFSNPWGADLDFPDDPTGSGRGKVARFRYKGVSEDQNRALAFRYARRWGQPMHFKGEFYIPVADLAADEILRKLVYWQSHTDYAKYTNNGGLATGRTVVHLTGSDLFVDATYNPARSTGRTSDDVRTWEKVALGLRGNTWYSLEVFQQMETGVGKADGILRVWLDGRMVFESTSMGWSDLAWVGDTSNRVPFEASDVYFEEFLVGEQMQSTGSYDEYRYWNNVEFSTRRTGR